MRGHRQAVGQEDGVGRARQPARQLGVGVQALLLGQRLAFGVGQVQGADQQFVVLAEQAQALADPFRQAPALGQGRAQRQQAHAQQLLLHLGAGAAFAEHLLLPFFEQVRARRGQGPDRRQDEQAAPVDFLPQARQAAGEQAAGLLHGVAADQQHLPQGRRHLRGGHAGQALQQGCGARQAEAAEGHFQAFRRVVPGHARAVGLAQDGQGQGRAVLQQVDDVAQGPAVVRQGAAHAFVLFGGYRQRQLLQQLEPGGEALRVGCLDGHAWAAELVFTICSL